MDDDNKLENALRKLSLGVGLALLLGSMYLSYDGFDQKVSGGNAEYTALAVLIGWSLAIAVSILEFILSSRPEGLNVTLKVIGVVAYGYSIWTNYLGAIDLLHMDKGMAVVVSLFMDIVPEPMIAWGLGEAIMHDLFKNLGTFATSPVGKSKRGGGGGGGKQDRPQSRPQGQQGQHKSPNNYAGLGSFPQSRQAHGSGGGGSMRRQELERKFHSAGKNGSKPPQAQVSLLDRFSEEDE